MTVNLPPELNLCLIEVIDANVRPGQATYPGDPGARQRRHGEQGAKRLVSGGDRLLELLPGEDRPALRQGDLRPLRLQQQRRGDRAAPAEAPSGELVDPADDAEGDRDRRLALSLGP